MALVERQIVRIRRIKHVFQLCMVTLMVAPIAGGVWAISSQVSDDQHGTEIWAGIAVWILAFVASIKLTARFGGREEWLLRLKGLIVKYGREDTARAILAGQLWQGMTAEMLRDAWGEPVARDHKRMKSRVCDVWKYNRIGRGRYASRVTVENGVVIGWDLKSR